MQKNARGNHRLDFVLLAALAAIIVAVAASKDHPAESHEPSAQGLKHFTQNTAHLYEKGPYP